MKNTQTQCIDVADILAIKKSEAEDFISKFDDKTKNLLVWYHGCTTSFIKELQALITKEEYNEDYLDDLAYYLSLEVDRHNCIIPFWENQELPSDSEVNNNPDDDEDNSDIDMDDELELAQLKEKCRADIYRKLLDDRIDAESEMWAVTSMLLGNLKKLCKNLKIGMTDGNKESGE